METINNVASAAAKAVWGESKDDKEPVSGAKGDVSKGEPYDAGNLADDDAQKKVASDMAAADAATPVKETETGHPLSTEGQTDTKKPEETKEEVDSPDKLKGPGPRPIADVAKEHRGNAAETTPAGVAKEASKATNGGAEPVGMGTEHVKSTGVKAEGGDFDATKPGAGAEADRLMGKDTAKPEDAKAPQRSSETSSKPPTDISTSSPSTSSKKNRMSLGAKIKAKLHRGGSEKTS